MRWYNLNQLEYYNSNPVFGCYKEPVFSPYDIIMQCPTLPLSGGAYGITISMCDSSGNFIEDATSAFDTFLGSFIIAGTTYYYVNIRLDHWTAAMSSAGCFLLRCIITDPSTGGIVFDKYTQLYQIEGSTETFVPAAYVDNVSLVECVPGQSPSNCNRNYLKLACKFDCVDSYSGDYYGEPTRVYLGTGNYPFAFERFSYIQGTFRDTPNEIKRVVSINCRTQKTSVTEQYQLIGTGYGAFPTWKMKDVESMILAAHLYLDGTEYQCPGGTFFEKFGTQSYNCQPRYKLVLPLQGCYQWQISGCVPNCADLATYYMFPRSFEMLYNERMLPIATNMDELAIYLSTLPGYVQSEQLPFALPCPVYGLLKVQSTGQLPPFIYVDEPIPTSRIFARQLAANTMDLSSLCNNITNTNQVGTVDIGTIVTEEEQVGQPVIGDIVTTDFAEYILSFDADTANWSVLGQYVSAVNYYGIATLNISLSSATYSGTLTNAYLGNISEHGRPVTAQVIYGNINPNMLQDSVLTIETDGNIYYTGDATLVDGPTIYLELLTIQYQVN